MLSKPEYGWTDFELEGTSRYGLSYMDDIPFEWIAIAIHGLQTMKPFCVKGYMEPGRFLCMVSYWNCHILTESDHNGELKKYEIETEYSHTSMLDFCKKLYNDISKNIDSWAAFSEAIEGAEQFDRCTGKNVCGRSKFLLKRRVIMMGNFAFRGISHE